MFYKTLVINTPLGHIKCDKEGRLYSVHLDKESGCLLIREHEGESFPSIPSYLISTTYVLEYGEPIIVSLPEEVKEPEPNVKSEISVQ